MPSRSNTVTGKAFEFAVLDALRVRLGEIGAKTIVNTSSAYITAEKAFDDLEPSMQQDYIAAAYAAVRVIEPLEPRLSTGSDNSTLELIIQADSQGQRGDVRDVVCVRSDEDWEIGISCKHNHEALKHPRITKGADFGKDWIGTPCSKTFLDAINKVMELVESWEGTKWRDHADKIPSVYKPILDAFVEELDRLCQVDKDAPSKLVSYFFGTNDFYKVIAKDIRSKGMAGRTKVMAFNMKNTLGKPAKTKRPLHSIPQTGLPTRLIEVGMKQRSNTTIEIIFDKGWTIHMRLHSADTKVKTTGLKWDVTLYGMPNGLYEQEQPWLPRSESPSQYEYITGRL